jgi:hypothetical protein
MSDTQGKRQKVEQEIQDELREEAVEAGVDVDTVVAGTLESRPNYGPESVARLVQAELRGAVQASTGTGVSGLVAGSRDRVGKNWPRRISLVRSSGDHLELSSFSGEVSTPEGGEVRIPHGCAAQLRAEKDEQHGTWELNGVEAVDEIGGAEFANRLFSVAEHPDSVGRGDQYEVVAVAGEVVKTDTVTLFEDGDPAGEGPVLMPDERGDPVPHIEVWVSLPDSNTVIQGRFERQKYGRPYFDVEDFEQAVNDAYEERDGPSSQADFVRDILQGREVVVVGSVSNVGQSKSNGGTTTWVTVNATALVESMSSVEDGAEVSTGDSQPDDATTGNDGGSEVEEIADNIADYCDLTNEDSSSLTVDDVRSTLDVEDAPDSVVSQALDMASDDGDASEQSEPEDSEEPDEPSGEVETVEDAWRELERADGTYSCPANGCLHNGSKATVLGHAQKKHADDHPKEWIVTATKENVAGGD